MPWEQQQYRDALGSSGSLEAQGCSRSPGNRGSTGMHQEHWDAPGAPGRTGNTGWRCGLKAPPRGSRGELPGTGSGHRESPGPRCEGSSGGTWGHGTVHPSRPAGSRPRPREMCGDGDPGVGQGWDCPCSHPGWDCGRILARFPRGCQRCGPLSAQSHQPPRKSPVQHWGKVSAGFQEGIKLMHEI